MAFVIADAYRNTLLDNLLKVTSTPENWILRMYTNNYTPLTTSVAGSFSEVPAGGAHRYQVMWRRLPMEPKRGLTRDQVKPCTGTISPVCRERSSSQRLSQHPGRSTLGKVSLSPPLHHSKVSRGVNGNIQQHRQWRHSIPGSTLQIQKETHNTQWHHENPRWFPDTGTGQSRNSKDFYQFQGHRRQW